MMHQNELIITDNMKITGDNDDNSWIVELETALLTECDQSVIKKITNQKTIPDSMRYEYWQLFLGVKGRSKVLCDVYDLPEQSIIRSDCQQLVDSLVLNDSECDRVALQSDLEAIITNFSKLNDIKYSSNNGWLEILQCLLVLPLKRDELFKFFEAINLRYIPKRTDKTKTDQSFHLLRLLLLYHEPELCSFLDTHKITPDLYANSWFRSLFSSECELKVTLALWDVYFTLANPFLIFFLSLVMLVNEKENILEMKNENKQVIIDKLRSVPKALCIEDIGDLFYLVEQHYVSRTPHTIQNLQCILFEACEPNKNDYQITDLSHLLCVTVAVTELLPNACSNVNNVRYFVVDCRPADQYNNGHLSTAFHLDCSLMLEEPSAFNTAVKALLAAQQQAIDAHSVAGGHHLCFMGSGRDEEDQYVHMVVASFLQKHHQFVSLAFGGYAALHEIIATNNDFDQFLIDHNRKHCIACEAHISLIINNNLSNNKSTVADMEHFTSVLFDKVANVVKPKITEMKDKIVDYVTNPNQQQIIRHVSSRDKLGKRYKGSNRFTIDDDLESDGLDSSNDETSQEIDVEDWAKSADVVGCFKCQELKDDGYKFASYLGVSNTHLFLFREIAHNKGFAKLIAKRPLEMIVQITSKKRCPDLITFKYGQTDSGSQQNVIAKDHLLIPKPYEVTRLIKQQVIKILDLNSSSSSTSSKR